MACVGSPAPVQWIGYSRHLMAPAILGLQPQLSPSGLVACVGSQTPV